MINKQRIIQAAKYIKKREQILLTSTSFEEIQQVQQEIENKLMSLSFEEVLALDEYILSI